MISLVIVTPELARVWADHTPSQYSDDQAGIIDRITADILTGRWQVQRGTPARLSPDGQLERGWRRCSAIAAAGVSCPLRVINLRFAVRPPQPRTCGFVVLGWPTCLDGEVCRCTMG